MRPQDLAAVFANNPLAVRTFIKEYGPVMQRAAARKVFGELRLRMDDLMQDLFLGLFRDSAKILRAWDPDKGRELKSYLHDFAEKRTVDWLRKQLREGRERPTDDQALLSRAEQIAQSEHTEAPDWLEPLMQRFRASCSAEDAKLLDMYYVEQCSVKQIAAAFNLNSPAVHQRTHRLKDKLLKMKKELSELGARKAYKSGSNQTPSSEGENE